jgi:hypothetical protein
LPARDQAQFLHGAPSLAGGPETLQGNASEWVLGIIDAIRNHDSPHVTLDRPVYFTASFNATAGAPRLLHWTKALKKGVGHV